MGSAKVSVVIPTYNHARYLGEAIESVLGQTFKNVEVIVVDDGSTDGTEALVAERYAEAVVYVRQENRGLPSARNTGLARSTGEYLVFLDADDSLTPGCLEKKVEVLECRSEVGWVFSDLYLTDEEGRVTDRCSEHFHYSRRKLRGQIFDELLMGSFFPVHAVMVRRACLDEVGWFDKTLDANPPSRWPGPRPYPYGHEDHDLWLRLARRFPVEYLNEPLGFYRLRAQSMGADRLAMAVGALRIMEHLEQKFPAEIQTKGDAWRRRKAELLIRVGLKAPADIGLLERLRWFWRAIKARPFQRAAYLAVLKALVGRVR